ncbi:protein kinase [Achlya hypogyna]|uniref:Protein kinase n=1 Tax=Achlya hypogyna TaxID=1202772 RepID=A0A1V9ZLY4_ACHHY|nr:protein kinase [Achlya hypogyna]
MASPTKKRASPTKSRQLHTAPCHTLPSPTKPAWDSSTSVPRKPSASNLGVILHNHRLAMTHSAEKLPGHPKFLAQVVLPASPELYGIDYDRDAKPPLDVRKHPQWRLRVHPLHGIGLIDPCRWRPPHVCSRQLRPWVQVLVPTAPVQQCAPSCSVGPLPVWSTGWLDFSLLSNAAFPSSFEVRVWNVCSGKTLLVGQASVPLDVTDMCDFIPLRNARGKPTGRIKLLYVLEGQVPATPPPRNPVFAFADLAATKAALRKVEPAPSLMTPQPTLRRPIGDIVALLDRLKGIVSEHAGLVASVGKSDRCVGEGIFASVYLSADGQSVLKEFRYEEYRGLPPYPVVCTFQKELELWLGVHHDNILELRGVVFAPRLGFVSEFMAGGSIYARREHRSWSAVTQVQKGYIALQIACALAYLHQKKILHRDLKLHNVLLSDALDDNTSIPQAKLCDFGSAVLMGDAKITEASGTSGYTAPEVLTGDGYSYPSDVWSFGIFLWEILSPHPNPHPNPFVGIGPDAFVDKATRGIRPHLHPCLGAYGRLIEECWRLIPSERPVAAELVPSLAQLLPDQ